MAKQPVTPGHTLAWLHTGAAAIVWRGAKVDGLAQPYTAVMLERYAARVGCTVQEITERRELPRAS